MKLTDIGTKTHYSKMNKIFESRFGFRVDFNTMSMQKAQKLTKSITEAITQLRHSNKFLVSERNPRYLEMLMVREGLVSWIAERKQIMEGEVGQAEALLAAKDIVDSLQDMIEKVGKIQNEQLPALTDTIRDQIGSEQAGTFKATISQMLTTVYGSLSQARDQADTSVQALSGDAPVNSMGAGMGMPADPNAPPMGQAAPSDGFGATDVAAGGNAELGRDFR